METVYLHGAEDVKRAGVQIDNAAATFERVAGWITESLEKHAYTMRELVERLEALKEK